jgi:hypothetical protein
MVLSLGLLMGCIMVYGDWRVLEDGQKEVLMEEVIGGYFNPAMCHRRVILGGWFMMGCIEFTCKKGLLFGSEFMPFLNA